MNELLSYPLFWFIVVGLAAMFWIMFCTDFVLPRGWLGIQRKPPPLTVTSITRVDENRYKGEMSNGRKWVATRVYDGSYSWNVADAETFVLMNHQAGTPVEEAIAHEERNCVDKAQAVRMRGLWEQDGPPWEPAEESSSGLADQAYLARRQQGSQSYGSIGQLGMVSGSLGQQLAAQQNMGNKRGT
jgi:hypothetical protein